MDVVDPTIFKGNGYIGIVLELLNVELRFLHYHAGTIAFKNNDNV